MSRPPSRFLSFGVMLVTLLWLSHGPARATEPDLEARATELANTGITALQEGRAEAAVQAFTEALPIAIASDRVPLIAAVQRGLGKAHDFLGNGQAALIYYHAYLAHALDEPLKRKEVEERIAVLDAATKCRLVVEANAPAASVIVDGGPAVSIETELVLAPGRHWIQVQAAGFQALEDDVFLIGGETLRYDAKLQVAVPAPAPTVVKAPPPSAAATIEDDDGVNGWAWFFWVASIGAGVAGSLNLDSDAGPGLVGGGAAGFVITSIVILAD